MEDATYFLLLRAARAETQRRLAELEGLARANLEAEYDHEGSRCLDGRFDSSDQLPWDEERCDLETFRDTLAVRIADLTAQPRPGRLLPHLDALARLERRERSAGGAR